jgi:hypothetical protein
VIYAHIGSNSNNSCFQLIPQKVSGSDRRLYTEHLYGGKTTVSDVFASDETESKESFAVFISADEKKLRTVFNSVEYLIGTPTGRNSAVDLAKIDALEVKQSTPKVKGESAGKITVTLGSVYSESGQSLKSADFYGALLQVSKCLLTRRKTMPTSR